jgi:hypothetical protein
MKKQVLYLFLLFIAIASCKKYTINEVQIKPWDSDIAFPLINSTFSVSDVFELNDSAILEFIDVDEGLLGITYTGDIFSFDASSIVELGDQDLSNTIQYLDPGLPISIIDTFYQSQVFTLDFESPNLNDIEAIYLRLLSGSIDLTINSDVAYLSNIQLTIPNMKKDGIAYQFESDVSPGQSISDSQSLESYLMDLSQEDLGYNQLKIDYRLIIHYDPAIPPTGEDIAIQFLFSDPILDYTVGYFGNNLLASQLDTIKIEIFDNTVGGHFQFIDPRIKVEITNSFGLPSLIEFTEFKSINQNTGEEIELVLEGLTDVPYEANYPQIIGDSTVEILNFDNSNSNIEDILNDGNKYLVWGLNASSNPNGSGGAYNFLTHESKLNINTKVTIPLKGYAWDWNFRDTTEINSGDGEINIDSLESIKELTIRLILNNGFPAEGIVQFYMTDSSFQITDSIFDSATLLLQSGILVDGIILEPAKSITDIELDKEKRENFLAAKHLITVVSMQTTNGSNQEIIQIYDHYSIQVIMGIRAKLFLNPDDL